MLLTTDLTGKLLLVLANKMILDSGAHGSHDNISLSLSDGMAQLYPQAPSSLFVAF
jgi:hypothetical protein